MRAAFRLFLYRSITMGSGTVEMRNGEILRLTFDEGRGAKVIDAAGNLPDGEIHYRFLNAVYTGNREPQWRRRGVTGGCLLFDGSSTEVTWPEGAVTLGGGALTVSAWIAPRAFEWIAPGTAGRDDAPLTAILSQYDRQANRGIRFGFHRFGRLCFQWGSGDGWHSVWADTARLRRLAWNHVAAVFDGNFGRVCLYLDGQPVAFRDMPTGARIARAEGEGLTIGADPHAEAIPAGRFNMFAGLMDELRVEARAVSVAEIAERASVDVPGIDYADIGLENNLTGDIYKTQYHGGPYQHWMNEPHAPLYYKGVYHLFFQSNSFGPYWRGIHWGHLVSGDTVRWRPVRDAIVPREGGVCPDGAWTGGATLDKNGVPVLFFAAGNDGFAGAGLISNQNIGVAWPADLADPELTDWIVSDELAVAQQPGQGRPGEFRDPHIWREGGMWYMVVCGGSVQSPGGTALLYETDRLEIKGGGVDMNWRYRGPVYELSDPAPRYGTSWELPILLPLQNREKSRSRHAFFFMPAPAGTADNKVYYFVGNFDRETGRFTPDTSYHDVPRLIDYGRNVFTGASVLADPATGRVCMFSIMQGQRRGAEEGAAGWAHCAGLTRNIWLSDDGSDVCVAPDPRLYDLLGEELLEIRNVDVDAANAALADIRGDMLYVRAILRPGCGTAVRVTVKGDAQGRGVTFAYNPQKNTVCEYEKTRSEANATGVVEGFLPLHGELLEAEVFIDRSLVEAFFNGDKAVSVRSYADPQAQRITVTCDGEAEAQYLCVRRVKSIYASEGRNA